MADNTAEQLRAQCKYIAETISGEHWDDIEWEDDDSKGSVFAYFSDMLDIEYVIGSDRETVLGARICVALGGPNIYVNTQTMMVEGRWWGDSVDIPIISDAMGLDEFVETLWDC